MPHQIVLVSVLLLERDLIVSNVQIPWKNRFEKYAKEKNMWEVFFPPFSHFYFTNFCSLISLWYVY